MKMIKKIGVSILDLMNKKKKKELKDDNVLKNLNYLKIFVIE